MLFKNVISAAVSASVVERDHADNRVAYSRSRSSVSSRWGNSQFIGPDTISDIVAAPQPAVVNLVANTLNRDALQNARAGSGKVQQDANRKLRRYYGIDARRPMTSIPSRLLGPA